MPDAPPDGLGQAVLGVAATGCDRDPHASKVLSVRSVPVHFDQLIGQVAQQDESERVLDDLRITVHDEGTARAAAVASAVLLGCPSSTLASDSE